MLHGQGWGWGSTQGTALHGTLWWAEGRCSNLEAAPQSSVQDRTPLGHLGQRGRGVCIKGPSELQPGDSGFELSFLSGAASCPPRLPFVREPLTHGGQKGPLSPLVPSLSPKRLWALVNYTYLAHKGLTLFLLHCSAPPCLWHLRASTPAGEELWEALCLSA